MKTATLAPGLKGYPLDAEPIAAARIAERQWNALDGRLPLPLALIRRSALEHNLQWMQRFARAQ